MKDLLFSVRALLRNRGVAAVALLTLVFGIVLNTAAFSVCNALWFGPMPFRSSEQLVVLLEQNQKQGVRRRASLESFRLWSQASGAFEAVAALEERGFNIGGKPGSGIEAQRLSGVRISETLLETLGFQPLAGRAFAASDFEPGAPPAVLITEGLWRDSFGARAEAVGSQVLIDGQATTVIGVLPRQFRFLFSGYKLATPLGHALEGRSVKGLQVVARIRTGSSAAAASASLKPLALEMERRHPEAYAGWSIAVTPLRELWLKDARQMYPILLVAAGFVLLIVCANISNILLARAAGREKEMALRVALGAGRSRLLRLVLTEGVLLAAVGGLVAALTTVVLTRLLVASYPEMNQLVVDWRVLLYTLAVSFFSGLVAAAGPAIIASGPEIEKTLRLEGAVVSRGARYRLRQTLVLCEMALAVVMLNGTGLLMKAILNLVHADLAFPTENLLSGRVSLPEFKYASEEGRNRFFSRAVEAVAGLPSVESVAASSAAPLLSSPGRVRLEVEGAPPEPNGGTRVAVLTTITPGYRRTLGLPLLAGRDFAPADTHRAAAMVNVAMAKSLFQGIHAAIGKRVRVAGGDWVTVVGVTADVPQDLLRPAFPELFRPASGQSPASMVLVARTSLPPEGLAAAVRKALRDLDHEVPVSELRSVESIKGEYFPKVMAVGLAGLSAIALALAAVGLYGVVSYLAAQRTREIGVRMALGAMRNNVVRLILTQGLGIALAGAAIGLAGSVAVGRLLSRFLAGVSPLEWSVFAPVIVLLVVVAGTASAIPAWSAAKTSPMAALRHD